MTLIVQVPASTIPGAEWTWEVEPTAGIYIHRIAVEGTAQHQCNVAAADGGGAILGATTGPETDRDLLIPTGEAIRVSYLGMQYVKVIHAITLWDQVICDAAAGQAKPLAAEATAWVLGTAMDAGAVADEIPVQIFIMRRAA